MQQQVIRGILSVTSDSIANLQGNPPSILRQIVAELLPPFSTSGGFHVLETLTMMEYLLTFICPIVFRM